MCRVAESCLHAGRGKKCWQRLWQCYVCGLTSQPHSWPSGGSGRGRSPSGCAQPVWWGHSSAPDTVCSSQSAEPTSSASSPTPTHMHIRIYSHCFMRDKCMELLSQLAKLLILQMFMFKNSLLPLGSSSQLNDSFALFAFCLITAEKQ